MRCRLLAGTHAWNLALRAACRSVQGLRYTRNTAAICVKYRDCRAAADVAVWPLQCAALALAYWLRFVVAEQADRRVTRIKFLWLLLKVVTVLYRTVPCSGAGSMHIHSATHTHTHTPCESNECFENTYPTPRLASFGAMFPLRQSQAQSAPVPRDCPPGGQSIYCCSS